jgi:hypothetical protein
MASGIWTKTLLGLIVLCSLYALTSLVQAATGNFPGIPVILPLSLENYFFWQSILVIPGLIISWLVVSLFARMLLILFKARPVSFRQLSVSLALSFYPFLFWLWIPHFLTALFYLLGMSQKEWVDLLSEPGWFQTGYIGFIVLAILSGWLSINVFLVKARWAKRKHGLLVASLSYLLGCSLVLIFLR